MWNRALTRSLAMPPMWLYPIIEVAQSNLINGVNNPFYNELRTIDIDMHDGSCSSPNVACLFALSSLRTLRLGVETGVWVMDEGEDWPIQRRSSSVSTLILHRVNHELRMYSRNHMSCKELSRSEYVWDWVDDSLSGLPQIMSGLEQQQGSLRILRLDPTLTRSHNLGDVLDLAYARVDGFRCSNALEKLTISFQILLGRPSIYIPAGEAGSTLRFGM